MISAAQAPPDLVPLTIDGKATWPAPGTNLVEAAAALRIRIPTLCYHPRLRAQQVCRVCLVEVEDGHGHRSLRPACGTAVQEGMLVRTDSPAAERARRFALELIVADHPSDCLGGRTHEPCEVRELAARLGLGKGRFEGERGGRPIDGSHPFILVDRDRCILCRRCVSACADIQGQHVWAIAERGQEIRLVADLDGPLGASTCVSCGQCVTYCPTGALIEKIPLGRRTPSAVEKVPTICPYCGCGCRLDLNVQDGRVLKVTANFDGPANRGSLCVKGRFGYDFIHHRDRLTRPLIRRDGRLEPTSWDEALGFVAKGFLKIRARFGPHALGVWTSAKATNEENYLAQKLARAALGTNNIDHCARLCHAPSASGLTAALGSAAATNTFDDVRQARAVLVIGSNMTEQHPIAALPIKELVRDGVPLMVVDPRRTELARMATIHLQLRPGTDIPLLNGMAHAILEEGLWDREFVERRTEGFEAWAMSLWPYSPEAAAESAGVPTDDLRRAARIYATAKPAALLYTMGITQHVVGHNNVLAVANLALLAGNLGRPGAGVNPLRGQNNVQGSCDMGGLPNVLPGYQPVADPKVRARFERAWGAPLPERPGLTLTEMVDAAGRGELRALYVIGENAVLSEPDQRHTIECLGALDLLVVQECFLSETAELAHVVLPAASFAEKDGTFTNTERRIQRVRRAVAPPGEARADWEILCDLATRLGYPMAYGSPAAIMEEIASLAPSYGGVRFERLDPAGLQWPCPDLDHPGTPILHTGAFPRPGGKARFHPVAHMPPDELPNEEFPLVLTTGRNLYHYHTGTMTRRSEGLNRIRPGPEVEVATSDAARLGLGDGDRVRVISRRGEIVARAAVGDTVPPGIVFTTFHFAEAPGNRLTNRATDPVARIPEYKVAAVRLEPA